MEIWLDDERNPTCINIQKKFGANGCEVWVKTSHEAIELIKTGCVEKISLDHDLGSVENGTGMDVAKFIEEQAFHKKIPKIFVVVHSMNPIGRANMSRAIQNANRFWE
jgi:hypothetical protein